ncbi:hypothetical protein [Streptomyces sp. NPDC050856]|uniref:hypothetical protein n=1 Tax=Streptomyces sp. NPDC050856 TaxID=3154939 RepID=UPI00340A2236
MNLRTVAMAAATGALLATGTATAQSAAAEPQPKPGPDRSSGVGLVKHDRLTPDSVVDYVLEGAEE